ncbi:MAG TPA: hypothetical protein VGL91_14205 [Acidobacteriota bacterium]
MKRSSAGVDAKYRVNVLEPALDFTGVLFKSEREREKHASARH